MRAYGNWCGPGWTAGQYKDASELTDADRAVPAIDELDQACKQHDIALHDHPEDADRINSEFITTVRSMGVTGMLFALAVAVAGPAPSLSNLPTEDNMPRPNKRPRHLRYDENNNEIEVTPQGATHTRFRQEEPATQQPVIQESAMEDVSMEPGAPQPMAMAMAASSGGPFTNPGKETPITIPPSITYGLQETHTTILPYLEYFTIRNLSFDSTKNYVEIRLNNPKDRPSTGAQINWIQTNPDPKTLPGIAFERRSTDNDTTVAKFPIVPNDTNGYMQTQYWKYYSKIYESYTVLKTYYRIVIRHCRAGTGNDVTVILNKESQTAGDTTDNKIIRDGTLYEYLGLPNVEKYQLYGESENGKGPATQIIEGTYYPGMMKRNVANDSEVKTWYKVNESPSLYDSLFLAFFHGPLAPAVRKQHVNVELQLKYTVQFKDLRREFRYPSTNGTTLDIVHTMPEDGLHYNDLNNTAILNKDSAAV